MIVVLAFESGFERRVVIEKCDGLIVGVQLDPLYTSGFCSGKAHEN